MKHLFTLLSLLSFVAASAQNSDENYVLVYHHGGSLDAFPESVFADGQNVNGQYLLTTVNDTVFCYDQSNLDSIVVSPFGQLKDRMPSITQFKINNKYNDQVFTDVIADITGDSLITAQIGAIGKWLTPSVQLSDDNARLYLGRYLQQSKQSRHDFSSDLCYTVAFPNQRVYQNSLVKEAVWGDDAEEFNVTPIALAASMFSSNLPGKDGEGFAQMLDGDINTFYHSTWDVPSNEKETIYKTEPYLDIALLQAERRIRFDYTTRNAGNYAPLKLTLYASNDGAQWKQIRTFTVENDALPTGAAESYESPVIDLGDNYSHLRLQLNESQHRLYLVFSEFRLWRATENPDYHGGEPLEPAEWAYQMLPFGRQYRVHIDWLTEKATQVPRVNIDIENGDMVWSKDFYLNATISIDGAGVYPSMESTPVQIKGRGNSSWSWHAWDKNPYRLKFSEKQKPFGLTKGKSWVLLANKQSGSMTTNAIGMKAACLVGTAAANHMVPVDLYINGNYRGSYNFTEKVGFSNNSVDLDDESLATLLELDTYYDETYRFHSESYSLPVNIKEPDFSEGTTQLTMQDIWNDFNEFLRELSRGGDITPYVDIDMLARFLFVNDLIENFELKHPKSTFLYKEFVGNSDSKYIFGPVWDLDWAFGYENSRSYFVSGQNVNFYTSTMMEHGQFISDLRYVSKELDKVYYQICNRFVNGTQLDELIDFCDDYFAYAQPSFLQNASIWNGDGSNYDRVTTNAKSWLRRRAERLLSLLTVYDDPDFPQNDIEDPDLLKPGDANEIVEVTTPEVTLVDVYDLSGRLVKRQANVFQLRQSLKPGVYIVGGKKMLIK